MAPGDAGPRQVDHGVDRNVAALARDTTAECVPVAMERGMDLGFDSGTEPVHIEGNPTLLVEMLQNLVDNALKYAATGGHIRLELKRDANAIVLSVTDDGPGIPEEDRERVLERFVRLEAARNSPGNGLGLSLVKAVSRMHGVDLVLGDAEPGLRVEMRFPSTPKLLAAPEPEPVSPERPLLS